MCISVANFFQAYSYLEVANEFGKISYDFDLTFSAPPIEPTNRPPFVDVDDDDASGSIGVIVGSVVAVVVVIIAIVVVVLLLWKKDMACFASNRSAMNCIEIFK